MPYVTECLGDRCDAVIAAGDHVKILMHSLAPRVPAPLVALGPDGFGRSDTRQALDDFFEVDSRHTVVACLAEPAKGKRLPRETTRNAMKELKVDSRKPGPITV